MSYVRAIPVRSAAGLLLAAVALAGAPASARRAPGDPAAVTAKVSEWKVDLSERTVPARTAAYTPAGDPPVRLWLSSHGDYAFGERAKVHARAVQDGYLVVLHADADGRVHVLFPIDPSKDQQVRGGKKYELKGRGDREAFMVTDTIGHGAVLAAFAKTPFVFDQFEQEGH